MACSEVPAPFWGKFDVRSVSIDGGRTVIILLVTVFALFGLAGCATPPENDPEALAIFREINDPFEPLNRDLFNFNVGIDQVLLRPAAIAYRDTVPETIRFVVHNVIENLRAPITFANDILQLEIERAGITLFRFAVNSTFGFLGAGDVAADMGMPKHDEDFGQTLAVVGLGEGPYLMLPLLGPSNPRDLVGLIADIFTDPWPYVVEADAFSPALTGGETIDKRSRNIERLDELETTSLDFYATVRSLYRQHRNDEIRNGRPQVISPLEVLQDVVPAAIRGK